MSLVVEERAHVLAEPEAVWALLADPATWPSWWSQCRAARFDGARFDEGSRLELVLQPRHLRTTFRPVVDLLTPGRALSLTHVGAFRRTTVAWTITPTAERVRVDVRGVFQGPFFFLLRVLQQGRLPERVLRTNVRDLRKAAERRALA